MLIDMRLGPSLNINTVFPCIGFYHKDKTDVRPSYFYNRNSYTC